MFTGFNFEDSVLTGTDSAMSVEVQSFNEETFVLDSDLFDFDLSDDISSIQSSPTINSTDSEASSLKAELECSSRTLGRRRSSKFMRKAPCSSIVKSKPTATHVGIRALKPNMSRRTRDTMLYAFPSFDRCDSLLFFPSTLAKHLNCGDISALSRLVVSHIDKDCDIRSTKPSPHKMDVQTMLRKCELVEEMHPDHITCIHSTKVEGNQIKGHGFMKFTCSRAISHHMMNKIKGTDFSSIFKCSWDDDLRPAVERENWPEEDKQKMREVIDAGADFVVHAKIQITITLDDMTKKIKSLLFDIDNLAMHEATHVVCEELRV